MVKLIHRNVDKKGCGMVAIYNAAVLSSMKVTYKHVYKIAKKYKLYDKKIGINPKQFHTLIGKLKIPAISLSELDLKDIDKKLKKGHSFIVAYRLKKYYNGHVVNIYMYGKRVFIDNPNAIKEVCTWKKLRATIKSGELAELYIWELPMRKNYDVSK